MRKARRNIRALLLLGFLFTLPLILGGGLRLWIARLKNSTNEMDWQFGQMSLFNGLIHLAIYVALFFQVRTWTSKVPDNRD